MHLVDNKVFKIYVLFILARKNAEYFLIVCEPASLSRTLLHGVNKENVNK